ncbi:NAD(P)-binding protein [Gonapodya prolifera JEL478]|uniref:NAD(P)-binding protein n=1 Tax=Gonapodya prolifera (strain JEL478) TaxID=1344416 RepID=A0A139AHD4_GONPJ|nr:NAD(P)-binding protein [Gonapodya prolifera JEL478]|eukprot:KXS16138.1 NAD(P)-binding protein [Gonapodya prolifera JEL478]
MTGNRIFLTGATGKIGQHLLRILCDKGAHVTAFVRNPEKLSALGLPVKVAVGDVNDIQTFEKAIPGHTHLFILSAYDTRHEAALVSAALKVAPTLVHVVKLSAFGASASADPGTVTALHGKAELEIAETLKAHGKEGTVAVTYLRPNDFMDNTLVYDAPSIKAESTVYGNYGDSAIGSISAWDVANVAAVVLTSGEDERAKYAGLGLSLTGPRAVTAAEKCAIVTQVIGKEVTYVDVGDAGFYQAILPEMGPFIAYGVMQLGQLFRLTFANNRFTTGTVEIITGQKPKSWEEFLQENKAALM